MSDNITTDLVIGGEARPAASGIVYDISTPSHPTAIERNFGVDGVRQFQETNAIAGASGQIV